MVGGARLVAGAWVPWTPPCATVQGPAVLAASSATELVAACDVGIWGPSPSGGQQGEHLYVSHDGGATFGETGTTVPLDGVDAIASPGAGAIPAAGSTTQGSAIVGSFDGGRTCRTVLQIGEPVLTYLGFTTPLQGVAITRTGTGTGGQTSLGTLLMTRDGRRTWSSATSYR